MKLKNILATTVVTLMALAGYFGYSNNHNELSDMELANIEALASGETIEGEVCFYKGNSVYETRIPCEADYPNIGPCGERVAGFYSTDRAQCYK